MLLLANAGSFDFAGRTILGGDYVFGSGDLEVEGYVVFDPRLFFKVDAALGTAITLLRAFDLGASGRGPPPVLVETEGITPF